MPGYSLTNYLRISRTGRPTGEQTVGAHNNFKRTICGLCNGGCGLLVKVSHEGTIQGVYGDPQNPWNKGRICPKPMAAAQSLTSPLRVRYPLKKDRNGYRRLSWEEALDYIAPRWKEAREKGGNSAIAAIISKIGGSHSKFILNVFAELTGLNTYGTAPVCYESERKIRISLFGSAATPNPLSDALEARLVILLGNNIAQTKAGQFPWLKEAQRKGTKLITIDVRCTETARQSDQFIQVRPGTDAALGLALLNYIIENQYYDAEFVEKHTLGFRELAQAVKSYTPEWASAVTGIELNTILNLGKELATLKPALLYPGRGVCCVNNGSHALWAFEALMAILGNIGKPGGGIVSHIIDYGKLQGLIPEQLKAKPEVKYSAKELYEAMLDGRIQLFYIAGNPVATWPDTGLMRQALRKVPLVIHHTLFFDDTSAEADLILPATHWLEEAGAQASVHRVLQWREAVVPPPPEAKPAAEFFRLLAKRLGFPQEYFPSAAAAAWELECRYTPAVSGISVLAMKETPGGISYPCRAGETPRRRLYSELKFNTPSGKIELRQQNPQILPVDLPSYSDPLDSPGNDSRLKGDYPFFLSTAKVAYHYHTQNQYSAWVRKVEGPYLEINTDLARALGIREGEKVEVETPYGFLVLPVKLSTALPPLCLFTQPYYSEGGMGLKPANYLYPNAVDPIGGNFIQKNLQCRMLGFGGGGEHK